MKFYLIDDDASVCNILKIIIQQKKLGEVCGSASNGVDALEDLRFIHPEYYHCGSADANYGWNQLCAQGKGAVSRHLLCHALAGQQQGDGCAGV